MLINVHTPSILEPDDKEELEGVVEWEERDDRFDGTEGSVDDPIDKTLLVNSFPFLDTFGRIVGWVKLPTNIVKEVDPPVKVCQKECDKYSGSRISGG